MNPLDGAAEGSLRPLPLAVIRIYQIPSSGELYCDLLSETDTVAAPPSDEQVAELLERLCKNLRQFSGNADAANLARISGQRS
jgi:hypothetical protein